MFIQTLDQEYGYYLHLPFYLQLLSRVYTCLES